ncbi:hypothetical protein JZK55_10060 [Dissulfurispira thermophila]|uniref:DUF1640 domain-containing protein n=2 Tax=root TaxID=1 RepID=A0A7G1H070_9BACT|nr:hypothetical protein [Dissulfurispira thermophila]BCB96084.1 hypothetical protein JZK55_10060 [Dissulfurispira thermophila]
MATTTIPIELYKILEDRVGKETAAEVVKLYEQTAESIRASVKISVKEELKDELVTKTEFAGEMKAIRLEIEALETRLEGRIKELHIKLNFLIILMIIAITLMNPVAAEIIKGLLKL